MFDYFFLIVFAVVVCSIIGFFQVVPANNVTVTFASIYVVAVMAGAWWINNIQVAITSKPVTVEPYQVQEFKVKQSDYISIEEKVKQQVNQSRESTEESKQRFQNQ